MIINVSSVDAEVYSDGFGNDTAMFVAHITFPEHGVAMGLSNRADDPDGMWLADYRFDNGMPVFSHGAGSRVCTKQIAGPEIVQAIMAAM